MEGHLQRGIKFERRKLGREVIPRLILFAHGFVSSLKITGSRATGVRLKRKIGHFNSGTQGNGKNVACFPIFFDEYLKAEAC